MFLPMTPKHQIMTRLSININKVATLRNARGENNPDVLKFAADCEALGAQGITVHPRPDERHIRRSDVLALSGRVKTEFNIEGYPAPEFLDLVMEVRPRQVTLVPDAPDAITSSAGWQVEPNFEFLRSVVERLHEAGIRVSIFTDTDPDNIRAAARAGADRVELYTKPYADGYAANRSAAIAPFIEASKAAHEAGLGVNAGHDLSLHNLAYFASRLPYLDEVSIGHAVICDALYLGIAQTIKAYRNALAND